MYLDELWIGDLLEVVSRGEIGRFEGIAPDGRAKVMLSGKLELLDVEDLLIAEEPAPKPKSLFLDDEPKVKSVDIREVSAFPRQIDLHMNALPKFNPSRWPNGELTFQLHHCKRYLEQVVSLRISRVVVITGKGGGVLSEAVLDLVETFPEADRFSDSDEGQLELWFDYS